MKFVSGWRGLMMAGFAVGVASACGSTTSDKGGSTDGSSSGDDSSSSGGTDSNSSNGTNSNSSSGGDTGSSASSSAGTGGSGTGGGSDEPATVECGGETCEGLSFGLTDIQDADACCPEGADEAVCGLDTAPLEDFEFTIPTECQPRNSPGELDESCPDSPLLTVSNISFDFPGCCLPSGKCGFMLDSVVNLIPLELGCVDATMFFEDLDEPPDCEPQMTGEGGASN